MSMTDLAIRIATTMDATGLNKADKQVKSFEKTVKGLGRTLGITLSAAAVVAFGKKAARAFIEDQKEAQRLTMAVKNLGLELSAPTISRYIDNLSQISGIADSQLRPAFQALLTTTGSVTASQKALSQAIDVSAGSGVALETVAQDLANAYVGQTRGLRKYNLGLTQAELKTASFQDITKKLNAQFAGANAAYLDTYAGKMQALGVAAGEAQERIGGAVIELAMAVSGSSDVEEFIKNINSATDFAVARIDNLIEGFKILKAIINSSLGEFQKNIQKVQVEEFNRRMRRDYMNVWNESNLPMSKEALAQQRKAEAAAKKRATELLKAQQKNTAELKKQNTLKKSATVFDMEQIQLVAALKGKLSAEERLRIEAQLALLNQNEVLAQKLTKEILMAQDATGGLYRYFLTIGDAKIKNPFAFLDEWLMNFQTKLNNLKVPTLTTTPASSAAAAVVAASVSGVPEGVKWDPSWSMGGNNTPNASFVDPNLFTTPTGNFTYGQGNPLNVNVYVQGSVVAEQDLVNTISTQLQNNSLSTGKTTQLERYSGFFL